MLFDRIKWKMAITNFVRYKHEFVKTEFDCILKKVKGENWNKDSSIISRLMILSNTLRHGHKVSKLEHHFQKKKSSFNSGDRVRFIATRICLCQFHQHFTLDFLCKSVLRSFSLATVWFCNFLAKEYQQKSCL